MFDEARVNRKIPELRSRYPWAGQFFFFTSLPNLNSILKSGALYSRARAKRFNLIVEDYAHQGIISQTRFAIQNFVRLYFGPQTPMLYRLEGIKNPQQIQEDLQSGYQHIPIPVYLVFDWRIILGNGCRIADGNAAARQTKVDDTTEFFENLDFNAIFHREVLPPEDRDYRDHVIRCRHAEILIPDQLKLKPYLQSICFRSPAERRYAENILEDLGWKNYFQTNPAYFHRHRVYIENFQIEQTNDCLALALYLNRNPVDLTGQVIFRSPDGRIFQKSSRLQRKQGYRKSRPMRGGWTIKYSINNIQVMLEKVSV